MFKNFNFDTKKYSILMGIIFIAFFIIVIKAFEYLPVTDNSAAGNRDLKNINTAKVEQPAQNENEQEIEVEQKNEQKRGHIDLTASSQAQPESIPEIQAPEGVGYEEINDNSAEIKENKPAELSQEEKAVQALYKAQEHYLKGQYTASVEQYRNVPKLTNDTNLVASAYEGIAQVYAANRKYGTALSFATKAYSMSPSSSREMLLARLYYKTGDIEKATKRVNNVLQRDFAKN